MSSPSSAWIFDVTEQDFVERVIHASHRHPVVVDFWAGWCRPCLQLKPILEALVVQRQGEVLLARVNTDEQPGLAAHFGIAALPSVKAFRDGQLVLEFEGLLPEESLREFLDRISPSEADQQVARARPLEETNPAQAEALYRQAIDKDPNHDQARLGLARVLLALNRTEEIEAILDLVSAEGEAVAEAERIKSALFYREQTQGSEDEPALRQKLAANPDDTQAAYDLGCLLAARGQHAEALELLLSAGQRDPALATSKVREAMVNIFHVLGDNHPLSNDYRARLSRLLY
jgi:putative thioredoxin